MDHIILQGFGRQEFNQIFFLLCWRKHFLYLVQIIHIDPVFIINMRFGAGEMIVPEEYRLFSFLESGRSVDLHR